MEALFNRTLVIVAHPDDEILGCGATIQKIVANGGKVRTIILGEGKTSRDQIRNREFRSLEIVELRKEVKIANSLVGVDDVHVYDFPDNRFDSVSLLDIVKVVEEHIDDFQPSAILTHFAEDMNIDHMVTNRAVLTASRPLPGSKIKIVATFEVLSSTGWYYPYGFIPNMFVGVNNAELQSKVEAMAAYKSELRDYPHPRSLDAIRDLAKVRGSSVGYEFAEAFQILRSKM